MYDDRRDRYETRQDGREGRDGSATAQAKKFKPRRAVQNKSTPNFWDYFEKKGRHWCWVASVKKEDLDRERGIEFIPLQGSQPPAPPAPRRQQGRRPRR